MKTETVQTGFKLIETRELKDIKAIAHLYEHEKTGAPLIWIENDDTNKVFSIAFSTPPEDSTGVAHILEHSVLCGSQKYPVKEPFVELMKGSLNTFLNAMTFSDKTMYPVASQNDRDFRNLMDVYMDAVFFPDIYKSREIFLQEGHHYEIDEEGKPSLSGVVYNEMKGAYSSPENYLFRNIQTALFPDTDYRHDSGGDPDEIPELTWQQFLNFHKKNYQPSNSFTFIYGDLDIEEKLNHIDTYFSQFQQRSPGKPIEAQAAFESPRELSLTYAVSEEEERDDRGYMAFNWAMPIDRDVTEVLGLSILEYMLLETHGSPLKEALIKSGLGKDIYGHFEDETRQSFFTIMIKDIDPARKDEARKLITDTLKRLVREGLAEKLVLSAVNKREFQTREADYRGYPKGLVFNSMLMARWQYGLDPFSWFEYDRLFSTLRERAQNGFFEELIRERLLDNTHSAVVVMAPDKGLQKQKEEALQKRLETWKAGLDDAELSAVKRTQEKLLARQSTPDTPEALRSIPLLAMDDLEKKARELPIEETKAGDNIFLKHVVDSNGIVYFRALFDTSCVAAEDIPYLSLLEKLLGSLHTENFTYEDLSHEVNLHLGGLGQSADVFVHHGDKDDFETRFSFRGKALYNKLPKMLELITEMAFTSKFEDPERLKEMIALFRSRLEMMVMQSGHVLGFRRILAQSSAASAYREYLSGIEFYRFIRGLEENFDKESESLIAHLTRLRDMIFVRENLLISMGAEESFFPEGIEQTKQFIASLPSAQNVPLQPVFSFNVKREAFSIPGQVQYVIQGGDFRSAGYRFSGTMMVARQIFSSDYLWNNVRVKGGAYGAFARFTRSGGLLFGSYRDPKLKETLDVYAGLPGWIRAQVWSDRDVLKYVIGTIGDQDAPLTPSLAAEEALTQYLSGYTQQEIQREREEILGTTSDDIKAMADLIDDVLKQDRICVVGNESRLKEGKALFDSSSTLL